MSNNKKRIGLDATALPPQPAGAGNYTINLIRSLAVLDTDFEFTIFSYQSGSELIKTDNNMSLNWVILPDKSPPRRLVWEQTGLPGLVQKTALDLLHSPHYTRPVALGCASVVTFHDMTFFLYPRYHTLFKRLYFPFAMRNSARSADALIAVSENTKKDILQHLNVPDSKIHVVYHGVDERFSPLYDKEQLNSISLKYNLPEDFILYVGVVEPRKNLIALLNAFRNLNKTNKNLRLVIVGQTGWGYDKVMELVETPELKGTVLLTGYIPPDELPAIYNLAKIFVYPSIYEGFGLPVLEALACGTPTITTSVSALPEIIGDAGVLVPPDNDQALLDAMQTLLENDSEQNRLSKKGVQRAAFFTWERAARETCKVYQQVLEINETG
jgi:glycosyltransferase involved in cell wall biosynthesis